VLSPFLPNLHVFVDRVVVDTSSWPSWGQWRLAHAATPGGVLLELVVGEALDVRATSVPPPQAPDGASGLEVVAVLAAPEEEIVRVVDDAAALACGRRPERDRDAIAVPLLDPLDVEGGRRVGGRWL
jgi:hypothetical protein